MPPLISLQAYLDRIGLDARTDPGLAEVHRAHATGIAFENFDPFSGTPVSLEPADLEDKIVTRGRGGYCFEHNLLLRAALESLGGMEVCPMLARVRIGPEGSPPSASALSNTAICCFDASITRGSTGHPKCAW